MLSVIKCGEWWVEGEILSNCGGKSWILNVILISFLLMHSVDKNARNIPKFSLILRCKISFLRPDVLDPYMCQLLF